MCCSTFTHIIKTRDIALGVSAETLTALSRHKNFLCVWEKNAPHHKRSRPLFFVVYQKFRCPSESCALGRIYNTLFNRALFQSQNISKADSFSSFKFIFVQIFFHALSDLEPNFVQSFNHFSMYESLHSSSQASMHN